MATNIYVLKLTSKKWYVGKTDDVKKRYQQHINGVGSSWTKKYEPISLERTIANASPFDEDKITKEYMAKYGIDNVRGGSYSNVNLDDVQLEALKREIWGAQNKCSKCGRSGHFQKNCYARTDVNGNTFEDDPEDEDEEDEEEDEDEDCVTCFRCGREGHISPECYAKKHVKGYYIR